MLFIRKNRRMNCGTRRQSVNAGKKNDWNRAKNKHTLDDPDIFFSVRGFVTLIECVSDTSVNCQLLSFETQTSHKNAATVDIDLSHIHSQGHRE